MKRTWIILALFVTGFAGFALADCPEGTTKSVRT